MHQEYHSTTPRQLDKSSLVLFYIFQIYSLFCEMLPNLLPTAMQLRCIGFTAEGIESLRHLNMKDFRLFNEKTCFFSHQIYVQVLKTKHMSHTNGTYLLHVHSSVSLAVCASESADQRTSPGRTRFSVLSGRRLLTPLSRWTPEV